MFSAHVASTTEVLLPVLDADVAKAADGIVVTKLPNSRP